jgi:hypothetical protein
VLDHAAFVHGLDAQQCPDSASVAQALMRSNRAKRDVTGCETELARFSQKSVKVAADRSDARPFCPEVLEAIDIVADSVGPGGSPFCLHHHFA